MDELRRWNRITGLVCLALAGLMLLVLIPYQVESGIVERVRAQFRIGDAMAPVVWSSVLGLAGLLLAIFPAPRKGAGDDRQGDAEIGIRVSNLKFLLNLAVILVAAMILIRWTGPATVWLASAFGSDIDSYRSVRGDRPWKYLGYFAGGFLLTFATMWMTTGRQRVLRVALICMIAVVAIAMFYDLPFKNIQLPPNQDI